MLPIPHAEVDRGLTKKPGVIAECDDNVPAPEDVARLDKLPAEKFTVIALPMKIDGGSGAPCRIVAILTE